MSMIRNIENTAHMKIIVRNLNDYYTCSFTEFVPFCLELYYFSNFKDFNTAAQA